MTDTPNIPDDNPTADEPQQPVPGLAGEPPFNPRDIGPSLYDALDFDWRNGATFADGTVWNKIGPTEPEETA